MARVRAPSRLHFGLLSLPADAPRRFGGAGLMIAEPGLQIRIEKATSWSAQGPVAERAISYAKQACELFLEKKQPFSIRIEQAPPEHVGLGVGTQLGLAVATAIAREFGKPTETAQLGVQLGRGQRSAIGVHGFEQGGFLVDGGKGPTTAVAPLLARYDFPADWRIVLVIPRRLRGTHGAAESAAFSQVAVGDDPHATDSLCRLLLLGVLPALREQDLKTFTAALTEFNRKAGEMFRTWQGGVYASSWTEILVHWLASQGLAAGQSSWGPTVFGIGERDQVSAIAKRLKDAPMATDGDVLVVEASNRGSACEEDVK